MTHNPNAISTIRPAEQVLMERRPPPCDRHPSATALVKVESGLYAGTPGATALDGPRGQLALCGHCVEMHSLILDLRGWSVIADTRPRLAAAEDARRERRRP